MAMGHSRRDTEVPETCMRGGLGMCSDSRAKLFVQVHRDVFTCPCIVVIVYNGFEVCVEWSSRECHNQYEGDGQYKTVDRTVECAVSNTRIHSIKTFEFM